MRSRAIESQCVLNVMVYSLQQCFRCLRTEPSQADRKSDASHFFVQISARNGERLRNEFSAVRIQVRLYKGRVRMGRSKLLPSKIANDAPSRFSARRRYKQSA